MYTMKLKVRGRSKNWRKFLSQRKRYISDDDINKFN